jgi:hypothetical protein
MLQIEHAITLNTPMKDAYQATCQDEKNYEKKQKEKRPTFKRLDILNYSTEKLSPLNNGPFFASNKI